SEPLDERSIQRARDLAELYRTPWVAEHFQCIHTADGVFNLNYVFPPLYTEEFLERFATNAVHLASRLDQPLVMENIPGFFDVNTGQMPEPVWLRRFFEATGVGFLLDLPHVWLQAHYREVSPEDWLEQFPLEHVWEIHVAGVENDDDLQGPWIAPAEPVDEMLQFMKHAVSLCPNVKAVTFDAFSPSLTAGAIFRAVDRMRSAL
ncbi:MAG: multinuclear nonheme iron-dependent oxidase, partial [Actinomycetota bacterium]